MLFNSRKNISNIDLHKKKTFPGLLIRMTVCHFNSDQTKDALFQIGIQCTRWS